MQIVSSAMLEESKVVFLVQNPNSRLFQQWSYKVSVTGEVLLADKGHNTHYFYHLVKVIGAGQNVQALEEEEENTESLVCAVLSALQELEISKVCYIFSSLFCFFFFFLMIYDKTVLLCLKAYSRVLGIHHLSGACAETVRTR